MTVDEPSKSHAPPSQEIESRRGGELVGEPKLETAAAAEAEVAADPTKPPLDDKLRARIAVYLIERESIRWRRLQWIERKRLTRTDIIDLKALAKTYARPATEDTAPSAIQRAENWIKSKIRTESSEP